MKRVILESPYAGSTHSNVRYAIEAIRHSLSLNEAPIASHLLFAANGILDDNVPEERILGIDAGLAWIPAADAMVLYLDLGLSPGMANAKLAAQKAGLPIIERLLWLAGPPQA